MDSKAVFFKTGKGEDESSGKTANLYSAIKRVLLMVDGVATFGEIGKRAAPSLRDSLDAMLQELEKGGYIQDKAKLASIPKQSVPPKMSVPVKMSVPKIVAPPKADNPPKTNPSPELDAPLKVTAHPINKPEEVAGGVLDFMDEFFESMPAQLAAEAAKSVKPKGEDEAKSKQEIDGAKLKAQQEAEVILLQAEQDAAKIREEAERAKQPTAEVSAREEPARRAKEEAEAARVKAEQETAQIRAKLEAAKLKIVQDAKARLDEVAKAQQQAQTARMIAAHEATVAREAAERIARQEREAAKARTAAEKAEAEKLAKQRAAERQSTQATQSASEIKLEAFIFDAPKVATPPSSSEPHKDVQTTQKEKAGAAQSASEIKLDPFFVSDPFKIPAPPAAAPQKKTVSAVELEPEIKLDFDAPKAATPPPPSELKKGDSAQTDQAAEARQPVESKPTKKEIKRAEEQRIAAQAQAKKQSADQARVKSMAEAEQREADTAKARAELTFQKIALSAAKTSSAAPRVPISRTSRKPFPWGKLAIFLLVLLAGALFVAPYVLPMRDYMPKVEQLLSAKLQQPVHIGQLGGRILPTPRLELGEIYIGDVKQFQVGQAQIYFSILGLLGETKPIDSIELQGVKVTGAGLLTVSAWLQQLAADEQYPVRRMAISQGTLDADAIQFTGIEGELIFNQAGKFTRADLRANAGKITLAINAVQDGNRKSRPQVDIRMHTSALPLLPSWSFDELTAKGELSSNGLRISEFDGRLLGGILQGNASIDWRSGWRAQGTLVAKTITMQNMSKSLSGDMEGSARFQMQATSLSGLADAATLDGTFVVRKGVINGIDIVEMARSRSTESVPGGRTHFDELSGVMTVAKDGYAFRQLKMNAGALIVSGTLDIAGQQVSGRISADLTKWAEMGKVTMQVGGTTDNPSLRAAR